MVGVMLLLRPRLTEANKAVGYFNAFAHMLMLPSVVLMALGVWLRRPVVALANLLAAVEFVRTYAHFFLPRPVVLPASTVRQIKVLTYNLHSERHILAPMVSILRVCDADIIAVQELSREAAEVFDAELSDRYPYRALYTGVHANAGQGILSRFPITAERYWQNPQIVSRTLGHLRVEIDLSGRPLIVYNTHPVHPGMGDQGFSSRPRGAEIDVVLAEAAQDHHPVLIMGDFNMTDQSEDYQRVTRRYRDAFGMVGYGMGFTFPDLSTFQSLPDYWPLPIRFVPFLRLDYVFHSPHFHPLYAHVWPTSGGSDHRPVFALLALTGNEPV